MIKLKNTNLTRKKWTFIFMSAVMFIFLMGVSLTPNYKVLAAEDTANSATARTINVTGDGEVDAVPDIAYLSLGVTTEKTTVGEAQTVNSTAVNNIISAIKKQGIASQDIKTSNYTISPKYNYDDKTGNSTVVGYIVTSTLSVTVKNISLAGSIIDTAVANGANDSNGVSFGVNDYAKYYNTALTNAISNAKAKAQVMAGCIDVKISTPTKVIENSSGVPVEYPVFYKSSLKNESAASSMSVEAGTYKIKASVNLVYEY
ncbi:SIMPL domain-containing protein [Clostridium thailandense]|uniref:SIMPL domain-containing protein n=1 Tax=Clostridium thailandense TaxID=2794346 RepID=UPI0028AD9560|nr:SIMPL domain-containing protein [Clostridium thailandense]